MKRILFFMAAIYSLSSCQDAPKADNAETSEAKVATTNTEGTKYNLDAAASTLEWIGTKPIGKHHGTIRIKDGFLAATNGMISSGKFTMDIKSLQPDDQDEKGNTKLRNDLLSANFFEAEKYPEATFEITSVTNGVQTPADSTLVMKDATHTITGNFTLKGITKSITFPAKIQMTETGIVADANFNIDRTQWGLNYGNDKSLGDKFIRPEVNIQIHLVANT